MAFDASQNLEDAELLARFAKGDRTAAQVLTARLAPLVFAQAFRMLGDRAEAEDVTQDSLLRLWHAAPDWQPGQAKVTTWLYRVTSNLCIDRMRKSKRHSGEEVPDMPDERPDIERRLQDRARAQALRAALGDNGACLVNLHEGRRAREEMGYERYHALGYFEMGMQAMYDILIEKGVVTAA